MKTPGAAVIIWLIATPCFGQALPHYGYPQLPSAVTTTTAPLSLYVASGGSDGNACTAAESPCLTVTGALAKVPLTVAHPVSITVAAGTYGGFVVPAHVYLPGVGSAASGSLDIHGTLATWTPATGASSGVAGTVVAGNDTVAGRGTVQVVGAGWTSGNLKGRMVCFPNGTQQQCHVIDDNTSDTITISGKFTSCYVPGGATCAAPSTAVTTVTLTSPTTTINSVHARYVIYGPLGGTGSTGIGWTAGVTFAGDLSSTSANSFSSFTGGPAFANTMQTVTLRDMALTFSSSGAAAIIRVTGASSPSLARLYVTSDITAVRLMSGMASAWVEDGFFSLTGTSVPILYADTGHAAKVSNTYLSGGRALVWNRGPMAATELKYNTARDCYECERLGPVMSHFSAYNKYVAPSGNACIRIGSSEADVGFGNYTFFGNSWTCSSTCLAATGLAQIWIDVTSPGVQVGGSSCTAASGVSAVNGTTLAIGANTTFTTTGSADVLVANSLSLGAVTTTTPIAVLRALSPSASCTAAGPTTCVWSR